MQLSNYIPQKITTDHSSCLYGDHTVLPKLMPCKYKVQQTISVTMNIFKKQQENNDIYLQIHI